MRLANLFDTSRTLAGGNGYYEYEVEVGRSIVVPWLTERLDRRGLFVGDFGCHAGGVLQALRETGLAASGEGFDLDARAIETSPFVSDSAFSIRVGDVLDVGDRAYDLILMRDVLEHVPQLDAVLGACRRNLAADGRVFVSFPPYYSPFGGHQQVAANWAKLAPYLHLLPDRIFFRLVKLEDTVYLDADELMGDLISVRDTKLTIRAAEAGFVRAGLRIASRQLFALRPEYAVRYGIRSLDARFLGHVSRIREVLVMGAFYLLDTA